MLKTNLNFNTNLLLSENNNFGNQNPNNNVNPTGNNAAAGPGNYPPPPPGYGPGSYPPPPPQGYGPGYYPPPPPLMGPYNPYPGSAPIKPPVEVIKRMRSVSIAAIVLFFLDIAFIIAMIIASASFVAVSSTFFEPDDTINTNAVLAFTIFAAFFGLSWGIGLLVCGIVGAVRSSKLKNLYGYYHEFNTVMACYIIGIFIPLVMVIAAFMALSKIKKNPNLQY